MFSRVTDPPVEGNILTFPNLLIRKRSGFERFLLPAEEQGDRILWREAALVALILVLQMAGPYAGAATLSALALWALWGSRRALQSLTISTIVVLANPGLVGNQEFVPLLKWILLFVCLARVLADWKYQSNASAPWFSYLSIFVVASFCLGIAVSRDLSLSLMKLWTFAAGAVAALVGMRDRRYSQQYWLNWFITVYAVILLLSGPLLVLNVGRFLNGAGFQGIFRHPQGYGVYMVPMTAYLTVKLFLQRRSSLFLSALLPLAWYSIFESRCRTAFLAFALAAVLVAATLVFRRKASTFKSWSVVFLTAGVAGFVVFVAFAINGNRAVLALDEFVSKGRVSEDVGQSREEQVSSLLPSIAENPWAGVGFGLSPAAVEQTPERDELTGLTIGASTEQGFLPLAVLTQVGIIGAIPLTLFIAALAYAVARRGSPALGALFWTAFFVNLGEMIFFSIGGYGLHMWLLVACCAAPAPLSRRRAIK